LEFFLEILKNRKIYANRANRANQTLNTLYFIPLSGWHTVGKSQFMPTVCKPGWFWLAQSWHKVGIKLAAANRVNSM